MKERVTRVMPKQPNNYASNTLIVIMLVGCLAAGKATGDNWKKKRAGNAKTKAHDTAPQPAIRSRRSA